MIQPKEILEYIDSRLKGNVIPLDVERDALLMIAEYREQVITEVKEELRKQYMSVIYENGYPIKAVPQATIEGLNALMRAVGKTDV